MGKLLLHIMNVFAVFFNKVLFIRKKVVCGKNFVVWGKMQVHGSGQCIIGDNVTIISKPSVNSVSGGNRTSLNTHKDAVIKIGNNVGMSHTAISAMKSVEIGDNVLIGSNCMIADTDFHPLDADIRREHPRDFSATKIVPVKIEDNVFIGARSIILKGVTIGENSVVGAGSVVTKDIPSGEVWAGNPAKFIRKI